ncbi:MAG: hypothetical protein IKP79_03085, partial [Bacilli bacterium]|nr:hypothetical protein [Bacilli bacterium]
GLFYKDELVSIMTFGKPRYNKKYQWELLRYCSSYAVSGGSNKLFKYFIDNYDPKSIISYCDNSLFSGTVYKKLGFKLLSEKANPSCHWVNRQGNHITDNLLRQYGVDRLIGTRYGRGTDNNQIMLDNGYVQVYDCGQLTFIWRIDK